MKYLITLIFSICFVSLATAAVTIKMQSDKKHGINIPRYQVETQNSTVKSSRLKIIALADSENFPISSFEQGSVFLKIFDNIESRLGIKIELLYSHSKYFNLVQTFERGKKENFNALWGVYYQELPYSRNQYIYPAIMTNNIHMITSAQKTLDIKKKEDLKNYKGIRVQTDKISNIVSKEFASLNLKIAGNFDEAYEELLTGKADYLLANYYPSLLAAYSLGIKKYLAYSKEPLWRMPVFLRCHESIKKSPAVKLLAEYMNSIAFRQLKEEAFQELINIYKTNSEGVVPPTYIRYIQEEDAEKEQTLEN